MLEIPCSKRSPTTKNRNHQSHYIGTQTSKISFIFGRHRRSGCCYLEHFEQPFFKLIAYKLLKCCGCLYQWIAFEQWVTHPNVETHYGKLKTFSLARIWAKRTNAWVECGLPLAGLIVSVPRWLARRWFKWITLRSCCLTKRKSKGCVQKELVRRKSLRVSQKLLLSAFCVEFYLLINVKYL